MCFDNPIRAVLRVIHWFIREDRAANYIHAIKEALWPNGVWSTTAIPARSAQEKAELRQRARSKLVEMIPSKFRGGGQCFGWWYGGGERVHLVVCF